MANHKSMNAPYERGSSLIRPFILDYLIPLNRDQKYDQKKWFQTAGGYQLKVAYVDLLRCFSPMTPHSNSVYLNSVINNKNC